MRNQTRNILMAGLLLCLALPTFAQKPAPPGAGVRPGGPGRGGAPGQPGQGGRGQRGGRGASLAMLPVSVIELITPLKSDQKTKITAIQDKAKADMKALQATDRQGRGPIMEKATNDIKAVLTPTQAADVQKATPSLRMINMSRAIPLGALPDVKLTKAQYTKIIGFTTPVAAQMQGLQGPDQMAKMQQVGPQLKTQIEGVLTQTQRDAIAKYVKAHPPRQGGGPGGPGGGRGGPDGGFGGRGPGGPGGAAGRGANTGAPGKKN